MIAGISLLPRPSAALACWASFHAVSAEEAKLDPKVVRLDPEIEPLVRLLEETPTRSAARRSRQPHSRRGCRIAKCWPLCFLAGVRNVEPRPSVGFKFHAVLVVNAAHLASLAGAGFRALAADLLGARLLQGQPGREHQGTQRLANAAGEGSRHCRRAKAPSRRSSTRWRNGTPRPPT